MLPPSEEDPGVGAGVELLPESEDPESEEPEPDEPESEDPEPDEPEDEDESEDVVDDEGLLELLRLSVL